MPCILRLSGGAVPFVASEKAFRPMARTVWILAKETGWSEDQILDLPTLRLETYVKTHNELVDELNRKLNGK